MKQKFWKKLISLGCVLIMLLVFAACSSSSEPTDIVELDILKNIKTDTVTEDGNIIYFDVRVSKDKTIRFGGLNVEIENGNIILNPNAMLFSLEYMGKFIRLDIEPCDTGIEFNFGQVYANSESVDSISQLYAAFTASILLDHSDIDLDECKGGFFSLSLTAYDNSPITVSKLVLTYDSTVQQTAYSKLKADTLASLEGYIMDWEYYLSEGFTTSNDFMSMAEEKMAEESSIESDIIAGIDLSSVSVSGDTTYFTSVMSNGEKIRFEATGASVKENGVTLSPGGSVTSLDSVGKIYLYTIGIDNAESYPSDCFFDCGYGYTYSSSKTSVNSASEVHTEPSFGCMISELTVENRIPIAAVQPNFIYFSIPESASQDVTISSLTIGYNPNEKTTGIVDAKLNSDFFTPYLIGELYDTTLEDSVKAGENNLSFYLVLQPDTEYSTMENSARSIFFVPHKFIEIGDLKNANGEILDKQTAQIESGCTLDITLGDYSFALDLDVIERYAGATTLNELLPHSTLYSFGENNTLVVPVAWADQTENATDKNLDIYRKSLGRVIDNTGSVTDYSDSNDNSFSLSEYFDIASYGNFSITSFITDWYYAEESFAEMETEGVTKSFADKIILWVKQNYPNLDWSRYDQNGDGYIDSLVIINAGKGDDSYIVSSYSGAIEFRESYFADNAGTQDDPTVNTFVSINQRFFEESSYNTLIHEFSHLFGIIDYYDVTYSGINAVGGYDMQSNSVGDWNAYSKMAVGWITPNVVTGLASGESVEFTIGASALSGDVIVIPAAGTDYDGPFGEYIMIDLFSDKGLNKYDCANFGLNGVSGIRISHVNANMEKRTIEAAANAYTDDIIAYTIGTIHYANDFSEKGFYNIEVIQAGKKNTFTKPNSENTLLSAKDLFKAGDVFTLSDYSEFFYNGLLDNGSDFGYTVTVVSVGTDSSGNPTATVRITAD